MHDDVRIEAEAQTKRGVPHPAALIILRRRT
jgi:hypothetical protein